MNVHDFFNPVLSSPLELEEKKTIYEENGFFILKNLLGREEVEAVKKEMAELENNFPKFVTIEDSIYGKDRKVVHKISHFLESSRYMDKIARHDFVLALISALLGEQALLSTDKINYKQPGGRGFYPHQDMSGMWMHYVKNIISFFIAVDPCTEENGCLEIAPGHHHNGLLSEFMTPITPELAETLNFQKIILEPGDAVLFDGYSPHRSAPNYSDNSRRAILFTYNRASEGNTRENFLKDFENNHAGTVQ
jgi:2-aminoethylphosphonate dioxygenase